MTNTSQWTGRSWRPGSPTRVLADRGTGERRQNKDDDGRNAAARWDENNPSINYRGEKRSNQTHCSRNDPEAMLARKGRGKEAELSYHGHADGNRNGLVVNTRVTTAYGGAACDAGLLMAEQIRDEAGDIGRGSRIRSASVVEELSRWESRRTWRSTSVGDAV